MKQWIIFGLAALGAYTVYQYYRRSHGLAQSRGWTEAAGYTTSSPLDPLTSGVPGFDQTPVVNRPDQIAAAQHTNVLATVPGGGSYVPAFGPDENRGGLDTF